MTYENKRSVEVLVIFLHVVHIILNRFLLVHRIEVEASVVVFDGLEECSESILEATSFQRPATQST